MAVTDNVDVEDQEDDAPVPRGAYGVRLVRGPFVQLPPHPQACADAKQLIRYAAAAPGPGGTAGRGPVQRSRGTESRSGACRVPRRPGR